MGKHEVGTPKYIANKIKSKGLQKLRWYCQMCQKQCRDENGFKCHTMSEGHHRQLLLFADNANKYLDQFSREFNDGFLYLLKRQFGTRRVPANRVYQDYIADRNHMHMNSTKWLSLTAYVKWLGRKGKCIVDETEKGWFITYIDRDPETLAVLEKKAKKEKMDKDDQERMMDFIEKQVEKGRQESNPEAEDGSVPLIRSEEDGPLVLSMKLKPKVKPVAVLPLGNALPEPKKRKIKEEPLDSSDESESPSSSCDKKPKSEDSKAVGWLQEGLVVKIITKSLGNKYYKAKGVIQPGVMDAGFVAKVKLTSPEDVEGHVIKFDQEHLETVIPAIGREVLIIRGQYKGSRAIVKKVRVEEFCADVETLKEQKYIKRLAYESICKFVN